jgi:twitching motility protein PilT
MASESSLLGRLAVHYKLITADQLAEATRAQEREGHVRNLGTVLVDLRLLTPVQLAKLLQVQKQLVEQQAARAEEIAPTPAAAVPVGAATVQPVTTETPPDLLGGGEKKVDRLLEFAVRARASDIHLATGETMLLRRDGELGAVDEVRLDAPRLQELVAELLRPAQRDLLEREGQVDFAWTLPGKARFRGNAYRHQGGMGVVLRAIPLEAPSLSDLGLPNSLAKLTNHHQGLVLITGPAGCGKSSTLAALVRLINEERRDHIITIEDPIEYLHRPLRCVVNQRQVGRDTDSFARALKAALREDPDVIAIGELRDLETISLALTAAETGHLVLATLHTGSAIRTVDRVVGSFPANQQAQIRTMLSESLRAVVSQRLVRRADGAGRLPALEVMLGTRAVANLIRESKTFQIRSILQTGGAQGMCLLDVALGQLVRSGAVARDEALLHADDPKLIPAA